MIRAIVLIGLLIIIFYCAFANSARAVEMAGAIGKAAELGRGLRPELRLGTRGKALQPLLRMLRGKGHLLQHQLLRRMIEPLCLQPLAVPCTPGLLARVAPPIPQHQR